MATNTGYDVLPHQLTPVGLRSTRAIIDLDALETNVRTVRQSLSPGTNLIAVVKANAYGHGSVFVARSALAAGASMLAVAATNEGVWLRRHGVRAPILVMGPVDDSQHLAAVENGLTLALHSIASAEHVNDIAEESGRTAHVHLKIDTGMHRYGCDPEDAAAIATAIAGMRHLWLEGVFTHFACADEADMAKTEEQAAIFDRCLAEITAAGVPVPMRHAANSAATLRSRRYDYDAIRLGTSMYGLAPSEHTILLPGMKPVLRLISKIARISDLEPGEGVSYGHTYVADKPERIALIPCGYADGYRRILSNRGWAAAGDERLPVRGRVCMDQLVVGLAADSNLAIGDEVTLFGDGSDAAPTADELAGLIDTINYEIATSIAARVPRVYMKTGQIVAIDDLTGPVDLSATTQESRSR